MKRWIGIALVLLLTAGLAACGSTGGGIGSGITFPAGGFGTSGSDEPEDSPNEPGSSAPEAGPGGPGDAQIGAGPGQTAAGGAPGEAEGLGAISFDGLPVFDTDDYRIEITGISPDELTGYVMEFAVENKSKDTIYSFAAVNVSVNGLKIDVEQRGFQNRAKPGDSWLPRLTIEKPTLADLREKGLDEITDIELTVYVFGVGSTIAEKTVHIYPYGEGAAAAYVREGRPGDQVLIDNERVTVIVTGHAQSDAGDFHLDLFLVNKTGETVSFRTKDVCVNGNKLGPEFITFIEAGKCSFDLMSWSGEVLEKGNITSVDEIGFTLLVLDAAKNAFMEETFTITM